MEIVLLGVVPFLFLLLAASMTVVSQISGYFQFNRFSMRERSTSRLIEGFLNQMAMAQLQLSSRTRQLEVLSARLKLSNEELARLNNLKMKFLSMAVHDIRTPLASINGYGEMLEGRGQLGDNEKKWVSNIVSASEQINHLLGDLTDLAVIEAGKFRMEKAPFDLAGLLGEIAGSIGLIAAKKGVVFTVAEVPTGAAIIADRFRVGRIITNLLGNAVKFTPAGGKVELRARQAGSHVLISVKDTGPGIHPSERRRIFEKFYQSQYLKDQKTKKAGWGLGLAISEEIVRAHAGEIGVDSPGLGKGSTFWVKLPLTPPRVPRPVRTSAALAALAALFILGGRIQAQQTIPLEDKAKFENALETRVEGVLVRILGPNRSKVVVEATVDFTRIERFESKSGTTTVTSVKSVPYLWNAQNAAAETPEFLPAVPMMQGDQPGAPQSQPPQSYERQTTFPTNFIKKLAVTLILDRSVTPSQSDELRNIVSDLLNLSPDRGDSLTIVHTGFAPLYKTIWYAPETASILVKYLLISLMSLVTLIVVAVCFLKLANAMSAMARSQTQQLTMEMKGVGGGAEGEGKQLIFEGPGAELGGRARAGEDVHGPAGGVEEVVFNVELKHVDTLAEMLVREDPANIALLATHLRPEVRTQLLAILPQELSSEVLINLGRVRFVEPDFLLNLKDEIERRLSGAIGGLKYLIDMLQATDMSQRSAVLQALRRRDPELARQVRGHVFLIEDLAALGRDEWSHLFARLSHEDWAAALCEGPQSVVEALRANMPAPAWKILEQMLAAKADAEARRAAQDKIARAVADLVRDGRIVDPAAREAQAPALSGSSRAAKAAAPPRGKPA